MPAPEVAFLFDNVIVWLAAGVDSYNEPQVLTPFQISGRWDGNQTQIRDSTGKLIKLDATLIFDIDEIDNIPVDSIVWKGIFEELSNPPSNLYKVISVMTTTDMRNIETSAELGLQRFNNTLPAVVGTS